MTAIQFRRRSHGVVRWTILAGVIAWITWEMYAHIAVSKVHASAHALCPFGGLESLLRWITLDGATLPKIFSGTLGLFFVSVGSALLFKRSFCGTVCPLGTLQDLPGALGAMVFGKRRPVVPAKLDRILRWLKYPVAILAIAMAWMTGTLWINSLDPWAAYGHIFMPAEVAASMVGGAVILVLALVLSFFYERAFCKYLCPMGAMVAVVGLASPFKARRNAETCINCALCDKACPVNLEVSKAGAVTDAECLSCGKCAAVCPVPGTLDMGFSKKSRINPAVAVLLGAGAFFLGIFAMQLFGFDRLSPAQEPTLRELSKQAGMTVDEFRKSYSLPGSLPSWTRSSAIENAMPLSKFAEVNGLAASDLKQRLGLDPSLTDSTSWGIAYGSARLEVIASLNGMDIETFKKVFGLSKDVGPDTPFREVRLRVELVADRLANEAAQAEHERRIQGEGGHE